MAVRREADDETVQPRSKHARDQSGIPVIRRFARRIQQRFKRRLNEAQKSPFECQEQDQTARQIYSGFPQVAFHIRTRLFYFASGSARDDAKNSDSYAAYVNIAALSLLR